jgi:hypothetical protein
MLIILLCLAMHDSVILKARYTQVPGTDAEYGQGAIERCDLRHREIERFVWLIAVDPPGDAAEWQKKLNAAVDPKHGSFTVGRASPEEEAAVRSGKIELQQ